MNGWNKTEGRELAFGKLLSILAGQIRVMKHPQKDHVKELD
jgi:hypothetical protein